MIATKTCTWPICSAVRTWAKTRSNLLIIIDKTIQWNFILNKNTRENCLAKWDPGLAQLTKNFHSAKVVAMPKQPQIPLKIICRYDIQRASQQYCCGAAWPISNAINICPLKQRQFRNNINSLYKLSIPCPPRQPELKSIPRIVKLRIWPFKQYI